MSLDTIRARVRLELNDRGAPFSEILYGDGVTTLFELEHTKVSTLTAVVGGTPETDFVLDMWNGVVTFAAAPADGAMIVITGIHFDLWLDGDLDTFTNISLAEHNKGRVPEIDYTTVSPLEEEALALRTVIEALWSEATALAQEIDVSTGEGVGLPESERYRQVLNQIEVVQGRYDRLASSLNIGVNRIENFTLRRVSRTTNRLVPVYIPQEYDDTTYPPVRVYPPIDRGA